MALSKKQEDSRHRKRAFLYNYCEHVGCTECGERDPVVLDFNHLTHKVYNVSNLMNSNYGMDVLIKEIVKTRVLCSNCHRRHTAAKRGWYKEFRCPEGKHIKKDK